MVLQEKLKSLGNGIFIELKPNLVGLAEYKDGIQYGENVSVYIKKIIPEKKEKEQELRIMQPGQSVRNRF